MAEVTLTALLPCRGFRLDRETGRQVLEGIYFAEEFSQFPYVMDFLTIFLALSGPQGATPSCVLRILARATGRDCRPPHAFVAKFIGEEGLPTSVHGYCAKAVELRNVTIPEAGVYDLVLEVEGEKIHTLPFLVRSG